MKFPGTYAAYTVINDNGWTLGPGSCRRFPIFWTSGTTAPKIAQNCFGSAELARNRASAGNAIFRLVGINPVLHTRAAVLVWTLRGTLKRISQSAMPLFVLEDR